VTLNADDVKQLIESGEIETEQVIVELLEPEAKKLESVFD
jgi:hypothetical protein